VGSFLDGDSGAGTGTGTVAPDTAAAVAAGIRTLGVRRRWRRRRIRWYLFEVLKLQFSVS